MVAIFGTYLILRPEPDENPLVHNYSPDNWYWAIFVIEPMSANHYSFNANKDQSLHFHIGAHYVSAFDNDTGVNIPVSLDVLVTDPEGNVFWEQNGVEWSDTARPIFVEKSGSYNVEISNNQNRPVNGSIIVKELVRSPHMEAYYTMVIFMSIPILILGTWLFVIKR